MLSCSCQEWDGDGWGYISEADFSVLATKNRRRCCSCKDLIGVGSMCVKFDRLRNPKNDIEERIHGDEVHLAAYYLCEKCGEIFLNLDALGYCMDIRGDMNERLREYHELTGFKKEA